MALRQGVAELTLRVYVMFTLGDLRMSITVKAAWDPEGCVECIENSNLPGLHTGAETRKRFAKSFRAQSRICLRAAGTARSYSRVKSRDA